MTLNWRCSVFSVMLYDVCYLQVTTAVKDVCSASVDHISFALDRLSHQASSAVIDGKRLMMRLSALPAAIVILLMVYYIFWFECPVQANICSILCCIERMADRAPKLLRFMEKLNDIEMSVCFVGAPFYNCDETEHNWCKLLLRDWSCWTVALRHHAIALTSMCIHFVIPCCQLAEWHVTWNGALMSRVLIVLCHFLYLVFGICIICIYIQFCCVLRFMLNPRIAGYYNGYRTQSDHHRPIVGNQLRWKMRLHFKREFQNKQSSQKWNAATAQVLIEKNRWDDERIDEMVKE